MHFVYILQSIKDSSYYVGVTTNIEERLKEHNTGSTKSTSHKKPFSLVWFCGFPIKKKAYDFERYLKAGSGMAFRNRHLI